MEYGFSSLRPWRLCPCAPPDKLSFLFPWSSPCRGHFVWMFSSLWLCLGARDVRAEQEGGLFLQGWASVARDDLCWSSWSCLNEAMGCASAKHVSTVQNEEETQKGKNYQNGDVFGGECCRIVFLPAPGMFWEVYKEVLTFHEIKSKVCVKIHHSDRAVGPSRGGYHDTWNRGEILSEKLKF